MIGPGKYDNLTTSVRELTGAKGVVLIIIDGGLGSGFNAQVNPEVVPVMAELLRNVADQMAADYENMIARKEDEPRIHFLHAGFTKCGIIGVPSQWPAGHQWSGYWQDVTCPQCLKHKPNA